MQTIQGGRTTLDEIERRLQPRLVRENALHDLDDLFRSGRPPEPQPEGFLSGSLVATSVARPVDSLARWLKGHYMPWLGKAFDTESQMGTNILKPGARSQMKVLWRSYEPRTTSEGTLEAFPFRTRIAPGAIDPNVDVLKIDYDFEENPSFIIRHILDELVQIEEDLYLGKILYRMRSSWSPIGFFSLRSGTGS